MNPEDCGTMIISGYETALFRTSWSLYDAITEHNCMSHREIYAIVASVLGGLQSHGPCSILDLGCGNARFLAPCLRAHPPLRYHGVDLSPAALDEARVHLAGIENVTLQHGDMLEAATTSKHPHNVVFTGFAVHHLDALEKQALFYACSRTLAPGGRFLMVDVAREEGETREAYLVRYLRMVRTQWTAIPPEQREEACTHIAAHDFPATLGELFHMAAVAGFAQSRALGRFGDHHVLEFQAP